MELGASDIAPARLIRNMVKRMKVLCEYCKSEQSLETLGQHRKQCAALKKTEGNIAAIRDTTIVVLNKTSDKVIEKYCGTFKYIMS